MFIGLRTSLPATDGKKLPERLLVAKWGRNEAPSRKLTFIVNETTVRELPKNTLALGFDKPVLDFEHNTLEGSDAYKAEKEPRAIAAVGAFSVVPGEGIWYTPERWTPEGEKSVLNGHHPDISPALGFNAKGEVIVAHSVALCRHGSVPGLHLFSSAGPLREKLIGLGAATALGDDGQPISSAMNHKELLCLILGLSASATDAEIQTAATSFRSNQSALAKAAETIQGFSASLKSANDQIAALQARFDDQEKAHLTALAVRDGKIIPLSAQKLALADFKTLVAELPSNVVPLEQRTPEGIKAFSASGVVTSADQSVAAEVRTKLGISDDTWKKYGAA